jgi:hypothetical protein
MAVVGQSGGIPPCPCLYVRTPDFLAGEVLAQESGHPQTAPMEYANLFATPMARHRETRFCFP